MKKDKIAELEEAIRKESKGILHAIELEEDRLSEDKTNEESENQLKIVRLQNWTAEFNNPSMHLVRFTSPFDRKDLQAKSSDLGDANHRFPLRLFLPPRLCELAPFDRLYIVYNGLGESQPTIYNEMCLDLAKRKKIPVIFLPLPLHYCRNFAFESDTNDPYEPSSKEVSILTSQRIFQSIVGDPPLLINSYKQTLEETNDIIQTIRRSQDPYWTHLFKKNTRISLFGYSFGGFSALAFLLLKPEHIEKVFLFESGGFIDRIDASVLFHRRDSVARTLWDYYFIKGNEPELWEPLFSERKDEAEQRSDFEAALAEREKVLSLDENISASAVGDLADLSLERPTALAAVDGKGNFIYPEPYRVLSRPDEEARELWRDVMSELYLAIDNPTKTGSLSGDEKTLFKQIYLGYEGVDYGRRIEKYEDKILIISGGADEIFPTRSLLDLGPDTGLALIQVPGITHWVKARSARRWRQWQRMVVDFMETFHGDI